ncbi:hypothetical protein FRB99_002133, partial [Tulasnella sp. 403]
MAVPSVFTIFEELRTNDDNTSTQSLSSPEEYLCAADVALERASYTLAVQHATSALGLEESRRSGILRALMVRGRAYKLLGRSEEAERDFIALAAIDGQVDVATMAGSEGRRSVASGEPGVVQGSTVEPDRETIEVREIARISGSQTRVAQDPVALPYELWTAVASYLPKKSIKSWLGYIMPLLFPSFLGRKDTGDLRLVQRSEMLLGHLVSNRGFATCVKDMTIEGWKDAQKQLTSELVLALRNLTELQSLSWEYTGKLSPEVLQTMKDCLPSLERVSIGRIFHSIEALIGRCGLKSIQFRDISGIPVYREQMVELLENHSGTLETLKLEPCSWQDGWLPEHVFRRLRHLYLWGSALTQEHLNVVLSSDSLIETLSMQSKPISFAPAALFKTHRRGLPHLRRLCIRFDDYNAYDLGLLNGIGEFLEGRERLEVLALQEFSSALRTGSVGFIRGLASLKNLKSLKLQLAVLRHFEMDILFKCFPQSLERVYIGARAGARGKEVLIAHELSRLPHLRELF